MGKTDYSGWDNFEAWAEVKGVDLDAYDRELARQPGDPFYRPRPKPKASDGPDGPAVAGQSVRPAGRGKAEQATLFDGAVGAMADAGVAALRH